jgi:CRISPR system Cascade subunit CasE
VPYLSRIYLNPQRQQARKLLINPQLLHSAVMAGIITQPVQERVLWRVDADKPLRPSLFVLTQSRPSWEHITEQAGWPSTDDPDDPQVLVRDYRPLLDRLRTHDEFRFRLTANPTQTSKRPGTLTEAQRKRAENDVLSRPARLGHRTVSHQAGWLTARTQRWGFDIPASSASATVGETVTDMRIVSRHRLSFVRKGTAGQVVIQAVTYEGRLRVTDPDSLRRALTNGVGPAKAYGCGLLTLAPVL